MKITYNDKLLATGSADGTVIIWTIFNNEGNYNDLLESELRNIMPHFPSKAVSHQCVRNSASVWT